MMYKLHLNQINLLDEPEYLGGIALDPDNEWVKLAKLIPWHQFEEEYASSFPSGTGQPTEFGQKLHLSVVNGYTFIEQPCWNNFNEGNDLPAVIENYFRRCGYYPIAVLADKLYQTRNNRNYCKARGIRLSGPALGRKSKAAKEENDAQMYQDACDRNVIEGKNGTAKRRYGLSRIMSKLDETSKTEAGFSILMMNAWKRVYQELLRTFLQLLFFNDTMCSILAFLLVFQQSLINMFT